jgi:hypothetical protein
MNYNVLKTTTKSYTQTLHIIESQIFLRIRPVK